MAASREQDSRARPRYARRFRPEERRAAVEAHLGSGRSRVDFARLWGCSPSSLDKWLRRYREDGPKGLEVRPRRKGRRVHHPVRLPDAVRAAHATFGVQRVADHLRRFEGVEVSPSSVRNVLREAGVEPQPAPRRRPLVCKELPRRFERAKYPCRACADGVRTAPGPDRPFEKGLLGASFLASVLGERFGNHMPYYRHEKKYAGEGLSLSRSVLERSAARCAERLAPLYELLRERVRSADVLFTDDTPVTIARPADREEGSKTGRIWVYLDRAGNHVYDFSVDREKEAPLRWLEGHEGVVHADSYPGYDGAFVPGGATEVGCWAHARRKFDDAEANDPDLAGEVLDRIGELHAIERIARKQGLGDEERGRLRGDKATPILQERRARLAELEAMALPKSPFARAAGYVPDQWDALERYASNGRLSIDNIATERALRHIAVGRKNRLFFQREGGGRTRRELLRPSRSTKWRRPRSRWTPPTAMDETLLRRRTGP